MGLGYNLAEAKSVRELAHWYRAAFHGHLAVGRAIAAVAPTVGPLNHKWLVVDAAYLLVTQAGAWSKRLDELTVPLKLVGSPAPAVAALAQRICGLEWRDALSEVARYVAAWRDELERFPTFGDVHYQDARLISRAQEDFANLVSQFAAEGYCVANGSYCMDAIHFNSGQNGSTPTSTPKLIFKPAQQRTYPPQARLTSENVVVDPDASEAQIYAASLHNALQIEFISTDIPLLNAAEYDELPIEFYVDMVRHAHDEMRHTKMLEHVLGRLGAAVGDFPFIVPDRYELLADQGLVYRLVILSRTGESEAIEMLSEMIPHLLTAGEIELARMWDYVLADEVRHTLFGNKWLRFIVGDSDEAVDHATRESIQRYNDAIRSGRLSKPPRQLDYLTSPGLPIETVLRSLAGFSGNEIDVMVSVRGARPLEVQN